MSEQSELVERVARAAEGYQLFSRFNDWTSDRVEGLPIEICRYARKEEEDEIVVVARFPADVSEAEALRSITREARARAAIAIVVEECAKLAERLGQCANTSGRGSCCESLGEDIADAIRAIGAKP